MCIKIFAENSTELRLKQRCPTAQENQFIFPHIPINGKPSANISIQIS